MRSATNYTLIAREGEWNSPHQWNTIYVIDIQSACPSSISQVRKKCQAVFPPIRRIAVLETIGCEATRRTTIKRGCFG